MSPESQLPTNPANVREGDILFDCPFCGKNMAIESAGAGLMVPCASCGKPVQVPIPDSNTPDAPIVGVPAPVSDEEDPRETVRQLDAALAMANQQVDRLVAEQESLQERRAYLEQMRVAQSARLEQVAAELSAVQDALDRAVTLLAEARAEKPA